MAEYKLSYESQLDVYHPSYRYESHDPRDWKSAALRGPALPALGNATAGAVGAAISNVVVYPLNVIVARLQTQTQKQKESDPSGKSDEDESAHERYTSVVDAACKIYAQQGIAGFYPGLAQDTWKTVADSFLFFLAYSAIRQKRIVAHVGVERAAKSKNIVLPIIDELAVGILAGSFAKLFTTPLSNIVARKQTSTTRKGGNAKNLSTSDIAARIRAEKGIRGFWSGYSATLILTLNPSLTFFLNEFFKRTLLPRSKRDKPPPALTFLLAALSKVAASSITYPFSLAKTRAQVMGSVSKSRPGTAERSRASLLAPLTPEILSTVATIARTDGILGLYAGLHGEVLKGFFSHGFTMLAKDAVYSFIIKSYYLLLMLGRRYPTPDELIQRAREQAEEYTEIAREGARDLAERTKEGAQEVLNANSGGNSVDMTSNSTGAADAAGNANHGIDASSGLKVPASSVSDEINETAELVGDYVEDEAAEWKSLYHWFWEKDRGPHRD
ncbi:Peroxisomal adenine nucleotide transporter [Penicillium chrysogenum]|uniref:Pc12g12500 protein n=2 Tax=Penicillium chrysogenum species complex TaxID=254878 RepID=B6GYN4_PENRW|nr:Peroxisomal adenine nucleotide transporter [Penicillium chrysogenum]CAP80877.1 Pc12g12500 [Penicillium rubens Wisconsin 54-1255]